MFNKNSNHNNIDGQADSNKGLPAASYILFTLILITIPMFI